MLNIIVNLDKIKIEDYSLLEYKNHRDIFNECLIPIKFFIKLGAKQP